MEGQDSLTTAAAPVYPTALAPACDDFSGTGASEVEVKTTCPTSYAQGTTISFTHATTPSYDQVTTPTYGYATTPAYGHATTPSYGHATTPSYGDAGSFHSGQLPYDPVEEWQGQVNTPDFSQPSNFVVAPGYDPRATTTSFNVAPQDDFPSVALACPGEVGGGNPETVSIQPPGVSTVLVPRPRGHGEVIEGRAWRVFVKIPRYPGAKTVPSDQTILYAMAQRGGASMSGIL